MTSNNNNSENNASGRVLMKRRNVARVSDAGLLPDHAQPFLDSGYPKRMRRFQTRTSPSLLKHASGRAGSRSARMVKITR